jgi:hypothetical protein
MELRMKDGKKRDKPHYWGVETGIAPRSLEEEANTHEVS